MIYNDAESLSNIYSNITKQAIPAKDQLEEQAVQKNVFQLSNDQSLLEEAATKVMTNKGMKECKCKWAAKGCDCSDCSECKDNQEPVNEAKKTEKKSAGKPDYTDVDEDGNKKESMKKALKDKAMKESSSFKELFMKIISEGQKKSV